MPDTNWEQRQKHAAFYQTLLNSPQQAAIATNSYGGILLTLGVAMAKFSAVDVGQDWTMLQIAVFGWVILMVFLTAGFGKAAARINEAYIEEHRTLFPDHEPYRLESFLLSFADRNPRLVRSNRPATNTKT